MHLDLNFLLMQSVFFVRMLQVNCVGLLVGFCVGNAVGASSVHEVPVHMHRDLNFLPMHAILFRLLHENSVGALVGFLVGSAVGRAIFALARPHARLLVFFHGASNL